MNRVWSDLARNVREFLAVPGRLNEIRQSIDQQTESLRATDENNLEQSKARDERLEKIIAAHEKAKSAEGAKNDPYYRVQNSIRRATWCAFFAATIYATIAAFQWSETRKANHFAEVAISNAKKQFQLDERPYIWPLDTVCIKPKFSSNITHAKLMCNIIYQNYGKSPAINLRSKSFIEFDTGALDRVHDYTFAPMKDGEAYDIVPPGGYKHWMTAYSEPLDLSEYSKIRKMDAGMVVFGNFEYFDVNGGKYPTKFCFFAMPNNVWVNCDKHQQISDDNR